MVRHAHGAHLLVAGRTGCGLFSPRLAHEHRGVGLLGVGVVHTGAGEGLVDLGNGFFDLALGGVPWKLAEAEPVQELCRSCREAVMPLTSAVMDAT